MERSGTTLVAVRLPCELAGQIDREAGRQSRNRSNLIILLLKQAMANLQADSGTPSVPRG